jgi:hypothetical protein
MSFALLTSFIDIKVFIDYDKLRDFLLEKGLPKERLPNNRKVAGTTFFYHSVPALKKTIVVWIDAEWSSGLYIQATIAHETVHVLKRITKSLEFEEPIQEEVYAQITTSVYLIIANQMKDLGVDFNRPKPESFPDE